MNHILKEYIRKALKNPIIVTLKQDVPLIKLDEINKHPKIKEWLAENPNLLLEVLYDNTPIQGVIYITLYDFKVRKEIKFTIRDMYNNIKNTPWDIYIIWCLELLKSQIESA